MTLLDRLESLRREHYTCEDRWFSCPASGENYNEYRAGEECDCGASTHNATLDDCIQEVRELVGDIEALDQFIEDVERGCERQGWKREAEVVGSLLAAWREERRKARLQQSSAPAACNSSISSRESRPTATDTEDPPPPEAPR